MPITIKEDSEIDSKIHHFIEDLLEDYGYIPLNIEWYVTVERMPNHVYNKHLDKKEQEADK